MDTGLMTEHSLADNVYTRIGARPYVMANIPFSFLGGAFMWPEVRRAMEEASHYSIDLGELQRAVGRRLAEVSGAESGMISTGAAGNIALATAACIAGTDHDLIYQLPDSDGLKNEVISMGRSHWDSGVRLAGGKMVVIDSLDDLPAAINDKTAMFYGGHTADPDPVEPQPLAQIVEVCHSRGVPVFADCAGGIPPIENIQRYARMDVDIYGFSGGKCLGGPQASGLLFGRKHLIEAALWNTTPVEGAVCRPMKVGKEEIIGALTAVEKWLTIDIDELYRQQTEMLQRIVPMVESVPGVKTEIELRTGSNRGMQLVVTWDEEEFGLSRMECERQLREGEPAITVLGGAHNPYVIRAKELESRRRRRPADSKGSPITVYSFGLKEGEEIIVGERLREILQGALARKS